MPAGLGMRRMGRAGVAAAGLVIAVAVPSAAAPGQLDPAFGAGGTAVTGFPSSYSGARAVAVQADGRIVAAGFAHTDDSILSDVALVRYDAAGAPDPTFGSDGRVRTDFGGRFDEALAVAVQADGGIVVAGSSSDATGSDMAVARYTRDGLLDTSFDGDGMALVDFGGDAVARAVAIQRDGKVVLAGRVIRGSGAGCCAADFALARLTRAGAPDRSFGGDGRVDTDFLAGADNGQDAADAVLVQADGRILAAGSGVAGGGSVDFAVARYRADGSLDPTFGGNGRVTTDFVGEIDEVRDLAVDPGGRIVAGGQSCELPGQSDEVCDFGLVRYTPGGALDRHFGRRGRVRTDLGAEFGEGVRGVVVQRDGRIVAGGETQGPGGFDVGLVRYRSDGRLDRGFGVDGVVITPVSPSTDEVGGLARGPAGRVVVAGTTAVDQSFGFFVSSYRLA
jgi:uncharacterized delta-60 repeat protein